MTWNIRKQKQPIRTTKRKNNSKNEDKLRSLWDIFQHTNNQIVGVPEREKEEQENENLFEKIMKENFHNLAKELDIQSQEAQSPKQDGPKKDHIKIEHN